MSSATDVIVNEKPVAPFVLSLIAGIFIILGAIVMSMFAFGMPSMMGGMGGGVSEMSGMMSNMYGGIGMGMMIGLAPTFTIVGLVSGTVVVLGSVMLYTRPSANQLWGALILTFSVVSIFGGMGGFLAGLVLGVVAGALALTWRPASGKVTRNRLPVQYSPN